MKRGRKLCSNVKERKKSLKIYPNVPHLPMSLRHKPRTSNYILESSVVNLRRENKGKPMPTSTRYV